MQALRHSPAGWAAIYLAGAQYSLDYTCSAWGIEAQSELCGR